MRVVVVVVVIVLVLGGLFFALRPDDKDGGSRDRRFDVSIEDGRMRPGEISVNRGEDVTLRLGSDEPVELHVHGYDLEREVRTGETSELHFEADLTGRFEIEDHDAKKELGVLQVRPR